jgi:uncharacterized protein YfaQ (DUF2300 family)
VLHGAGIEFREGKSPLLSICPMDGKFRVKANFLLADQLSLLTMKPQKTRIFGSEYGARQGGLIAADRSPQPRGGAQGWREQGRP